jgi:hypothetical protein
MGIVTGLTAARMMAIEAASVVSGIVSGDNLILTKHDGSTINAGNVRGATGAPGISASDVQGRNRIINGGFTINQRSFSSGQVNNVYTLDRWGVTFVGGSMMTSVDGSDATLAAMPEDEEFYNIMQFNPINQSEAGHHSYLWQKIENIRTLANKTATVSFWAKTWDGTTAKVGVSLVQDFGIVDGVSAPVPFTDVETGAGSVTVNPTWTRYSLTVDVPSLQGKYIASNFNHNLTLRIYLSAGSNFNSLFGTTLGFPSNAIFITGVQVEENPFATKFEYRTLAQELELCRRYYQQYQMVSARAAALKSHIICAPADLGDLRITPIDPIATVELVTYGGGTHIADNPAVTVAAYGKGSSELWCLMPPEQVETALAAGWCHWFNVKISNEL